MDFSNRELRLIGEVQHLLRWRQQEVIDLSEVVNGAIIEMARADADRVIPHCLALLPEEARPHVDDCLAYLAAADYWDVFRVVGCGPSEEKKAWLQIRYRAVAVKIRENYQRSGDQIATPEELAVPEVDRFLELLRGSLADGGERCRTEGCNEPRVRSSVLCPRHHYEMIVKKPPPNY